MPLKAYARGGRGAPHMKRVRMLIVSFRGANFGFWLSLRVFWEKTPSYLAVKVSFRVAREKNYIKMCTFFWSLLGVKKSLGLAQIGLLYRFNSKFLTSIPNPFICGVHPPGAYLYLTFQLTFQITHFLRQCQNI